MQIEGKLTKWNDDRGFGFITSNLGGQEIFVHASAFPKDGRRPRLGESLSFEIELDKDGRKRAKSISRPALASVHPVRHRESVRSRKTRGPIGRVALLLFVLLLGTAAYNKYFNPANVRPVAAELDSIGKTESPTSSPASLGTSAAPVTATGFKCDGRILCSQMTSCAEATFFLRNCPGVKMDGDNDGIPCEEQWCTSSFGK